LDACTAFRQSDLQGATIFWYVFAFVWLVGFITLERLWISMRTEQANG